jgi:hypothetical protein
VPYGQSKTMPERDIGKLLVKAHTAGPLRREAMESLASREGIGQAVAAGMGPFFNLPPGADVLLVSLMPDNSGSIGVIGAEQAVCHGHNRIVAALGESSQRGYCFVHTRYLNGGVLNPYTPYDRATPMHCPTNYRPTGRTPLFDQAVVLLGTVMAKTAELEAHGATVRTLTVLMTDGDDTSSQKMTPASVAWLVRDMQSSRAHLVVGMGIADGKTDFCEVFQSMGIARQWITTPDHDPASILNAFDTVRRAVSAANGGPAAFGRLLDSGGL